MSTIANTSPIAQVAILHGQLVTNSTKISDVFGKRHSHVLRAIESMECPTEFMSAHFWAHEELVQAGAVKRVSKSYNLTKDGFMLLVMGFTGAKAMAAKIAYINEFNRMAAELNSPTHK
ncbi:MAG: Rha family transcriptional regulator, partial [Aeromonas sp.]